MKFSQTLLEKVTEIWEKTHQHPFVTGLGKGDLPIESFIRYMKQDYVFLIDYSKLFALGAVKAKNIETMGKFAGLLNETLHGEMDLHRQYAERFGISLRQLEEEEPTASPGPQVHVSPVGMMPAPSTIRMIVRSGARVRLGLGVPGDG